MQPPPAPLLRRPVAENPETHALVILDAVIVPERSPVVGLPPLAGNPLGTVCLGNAMPNSPPHEESRRVIGKECSGFDRFGRVEQAGRAGKIGRPCLSIV